MNPEICRWNRILTCKYTNWNSICIFAFYESHSSNSCNFYGKCVIPRACLFPRVKVYLCVTRGRNVAFIVKKRVEQRAATTYKRSTRLQIIIHTVSNFFSHFSGERFRANFYKIFLATFPLRWKLKSILRMILWMFSFKIDRLRIHILGIDLLRIRITHRTSMRMCGRSILRRCAVISNQEISCAVD